MGKQKQLKKRRRLLRLGNSIMQLIAADPAMASKFAELQALKQTGQVNEQLWHKKMAELSNMVTFSLSKTENAK